MPIYVELLPLPRGRWVVKVGWNRREFEDRESADAYFQQVCEQIKKDYPSHHR